MTHCTYHVYSIINVIYLNPGHFLCRLKTIQIVLSPIQISSGGLNWDLGHGLDSVDKQRMSKRIMSMKGIADAVSRCRVVSGVYSDLF